MYDGDPRELLLSHLDLLQRVAESVCHRHNASDLAEDFHSEVRLKLIDNDYEVLRRFRGDAKFSTYLTTVVHNFFVDYTKERWGRFRPSVAAKRLGSQAVELETLIHRDGFSQSEAVRIASARGPRSHRLLEENLSKLPVRRPRPTRVNGDASIESVAAGDSPERIAAQESVGRHAEGALLEALECLSPRERALLKFRYRDGFTVAEMSRVLHLDQKRLYRQMDAVLAKVREALEALGLKRSDVTELLERSTDLCIDWRAKSE